MKFFILNMPHAALAALLRLNNAGKWACDRFTEDVDFGKTIIFSDEAHFDLGGM